GGRLEVRHADARAVLAIETFDVVYIDPMFPPKRKTSALPRKEIVMLRRLVGDDPDAAALLACARAAGARVVVKRADEAPALGDGVVAAHRGKTVRYDVHR
ncbi:MAG: class I SAM-dependent methyltransferase, partial [Phycisphaerales bacterium]|nr:class I SAM-dependent methyltransferase [Phycisphaerales bacterium]